MKRLSLLVVILFLSHSLIFAQEKGEKLPYKQWEIGVNVGVSNFAGSSIVSKSEFLKGFNNFKGDMNFGYGLLVKKNFTSVFALEGAYNGTSLTGTPKSGFSYKAFKTDVNEFDLNTVWNMSNLFSKNKFDRKIYWYTKLGVGVTNVNNKEFTHATVQNAWRYWTLPVGTGLVFRITDNVRLDLGTQLSWVNSNRLDGTNQFTLTSANPNGYLIGQVREKYFYTHAGLNFMLGKKPAKPAPVVEAPKPQPKPEPKPEPKPAPPAPPKHVIPACVGQIFKVYFAFDKWDLNSSSIAELDRLAKDMKENPSVDLEMRSHTDSRGPASYNMKLSEKRGKSVLDYLTAKGISSSRINAQAFGETQLVNKCKDGVRCKEAEHALNRRTETLVIE
jgi:outer membrane protein OmpA-like peptidoglycan-associated protein